MTVAMTGKDLATVVGITITPFDDRDRIDEGAFRRILSRAVDGGMKTVTVNGNTSEFASLTSEERRRALEITVSEARDVVVIAGVGLSIGGAISDAVSARDSGARGIMVHQPSHPFWSRAGWVDYHAAIAEAVPEMGIIPYIKDPRIDVATIRKLADSCSNMVGIKYAIDDPGTVAELVSVLGDDVPVVCGLAEMWAPFFWVAGTVGFTSGLVNVDPSRSMTMLRKLQTNDIRGAMEEWRLVREFEMLRARAESEMNVSVVKEALSLLGLCARRVRPPLIPVNVADRARVGEILRDWRVENA